MQSEDVTRWFAKTLTQMECFPSLIGTLYSTPKKSRFVVLGQWLDKQFPLPSIVNRDYEKETEHMSFGEIVAYALLKSLDRNLLLELIDNHVNEVPEVHRGTTERD